MLDSYGAMVVIAGGAGSGKSNFLFSKVIETMTSKEPKEGVFFFDAYSLRHANTKVLEGVNGAETYNAVYLQSSSTEESVEKGLGYLEDKLKSGKNAKVFVDINNTILKQKILKQLIELTDKYPNQSLKGVITSQTNLSHTPKEGVDMYKGSYVLVGGELTFVKQ